MKQCSHKKAKVDAGSLDIFVYYFTMTTVWGEYLRIRREINPRIMRLSITFP